MDESYLLSRITISPDGKPWLEEPKIWVSVIHTLLAVGWSNDEILSAYAGLEEEDIQACIIYGAQHPA